MDAAIAAALAREAVKKKPVLEKAEVNAHKKPKEKIEVEPQLLTELKKAELKERESFQVNVEPAPSVNVQLKKAEVQERPKIEVNAQPLPKVELRKTAGPKTLSSDTSAEKLYTSSGPSVQLKKTDGPTTSSSSSSEDDGRPTKEPQFAVKLKKTEIKERPSITTNSTTLPGMSILKKTEATSSNSSNSSSTSSSTTTTQIDFKANLRKPGKGRMKHLEKFYDTNNNNNDNTTNTNTADQ